LHYRLFLLDPSGSVRARFGIESHDDTTAIREALAFANGEPFEVWRETELVFRHPGLPGAAIEET
jgi:hypothetical protein